VVATVGGTAFGSIDPVGELLELRERYGFRLHVDAAYGGYFILADLEPAVRQTFDALRDVDSIVVDPHKHGLQPYGCGCVLFADPRVGRLYRHDSPYTYFTSNELHLGEISLECSRPGAAAVALWATQRLLPLERNGTFAADLTKCLQAARAWHRRVAADGRFLAGPQPALDIVVWALAGPDGAAISARTRAAFDAAAKQNLHLALLNVPPALAEMWWPPLTIDEPLTCLRSCLMKPAHLDWLERLWAIFIGGLPHYGNPGIKK
jgi:glutamate/tyrosine decarboxylase-like PLP-dependent enzyme